MSTIVAGSLAYSTFWVISFVVKLEGANMPSNNDALSQRAAAFGQTPYRVRPESEVLYIQYKEGTPRTVR